MRCNHCTDVPYIKICPTHAPCKRDDGIVDFDNERCIGRKSCMHACPYDAIYIDEDTHTAAKCNPCAQSAARWTHIRAAAELPAGGGLDHHVEYDAKAHRRRGPHEFMLVPTTCFDCESACGLLVYVDKSDLSIKTLEGNPAHPGRVAAPVRRTRRPSTRATTPNASSTP